MVLKPIGKLTTRDKVLIVAILGVLSMTLLGWFKPRLSPEDLARMPMQELRDVTLYHEAMVFRIERSHWAVLLRHIGDLRHAWEAWEPTRGQSVHNLACIEMDWLKSGRVWLRLQASKSSTDWVFAWLETPYGEKGLENQGGPFDARELYAWLERMQVEFRPSGRQAADAGCRLH